MIFLIRHAVCAHLKTVNLSRTSFNMKVGNEFISFFSVQSYVLAKNPEKYKAKFLSF